MEPAPETRYARAGDGVHIAYHVFGAGGVDVVGVPGFVSHLELGWEAPPRNHPTRPLGDFARVVAFDKRGTGLSDRVQGVPPLEVRMDDLRAVMDAAGIERAALLGISEGGPMAIMFAVTYPERTSALIFEGSFARIVQDPPDYPWGYRADDIDSVTHGFESVWGSGEALLSFFPSARDDPLVRDWAARCERNSATPGAMADIVRTIAATDVRPLLAAVRVPTLVLHAREDAMVPVELGRYLAAHIPNARYIEYDQGDHWVDARGDIEEFLTGARHEPEPERVLATILYTDIVSSTERLYRVGDEKWREVLEAHERSALRQLERFRGRLVKSTGDGILAIFDGPARAIRCAGAIRDAVRPLGIELRAGLHAGEIELVGADIAGISVHIAERVTGLARADMVLVSSTVKDLVAGSGLTFVDYGLHPLKGVPDQWHLYAVDA